jgi:hypothetical protein
MRKPWKTIFGFSLLGLAIAGASYAYWAFYDYTKPMNGIRLVVATVSMISCPPQLLFVLCIDSEVIGWAEHSQEQAAMAELATGGGLVPEKSRNRTCQVRGLYIDDFRVNRHLGQILISACLAAA